MHHTINCLLHVGRWAIPVPEFALNFAFGERAELLTKGAKILPTRAQQLGFQFNHPDLQQALYHIFAQHQWSSFSNVETK
jgi:NAD dependent epimerase/dehydratase family enzyme